MKEVLNPRIDPKKVKILVVDDIPLNVLLVKKMLQPLGFDTSEAEDGVVAMEKIGADKPDLILLDLMMPRMDGFEVLRRLRASDDTKSIPVIILSALNSNDDVAKGISMGAEDYITKPIIMDRLQSSVIKQLNKLFE
ncbi:MAG: response regulator [Prevotella sp.]|nr:response regulator [Prevotella sp.]MBQ2534407.1 response regulator [Prevotella sp.]